MFALTCHTLNVKTCYSLTHFQTESGLQTVWYSSIEAPQHLKWTSRDAENCDCYNHRALKETEKVKSKMKCRDTTQITVLCLEVVSAFPPQAHLPLRGIFLNEILAVSMTLPWDHLRKRGSLLSTMWWIALFHANTSGRAKTKRFYNISRITSQIQESQTSHEGRWRQFVTISVQTRTWMWNKSYSTCRTCV